MSEKSESSPGSVFIPVLVLVLLWIIVSRMIIPKIRSSEGREKACYGNMRVILGAVEMYNADHSVLITSISSSTISMLRASEYIKSDGTCRCPGKEEKRHADPFIQGLVEIFAGGPSSCYALRIAPADPYSGANMASGGRVVCSIHGIAEE